MKYIGTAVNRSRTVVSLLIGIMLLGVFSYTTIPLESNPDVSVPVFIVTVPHEGISPEDAERLLARPMELELKTLDGVDEINSYAGEGSATIVVEFDFEVDLDQALLDVREAVDKARVKIPSTAEEPFIREVSALDFPVITIALGSDNVSDRVLYRLARDLKDELEGLREVVEARVNGAREELLEAIVQPAQLHAYGITDEELIQAVARNNRLIPAGAVDTGKGSFSVKIPGVIESVEDVMSIPVKATVNGVVTLDDVTTVRRSFKDPRSFTRANGLPAVAVEVSKRKGVSLVDGITRVKEVVERESGRYPAGVNVSYIADQAPATVEQISTLQGNISTAMFLVLTVVVAAVGIRSGFLVALGIPFSFLFAFIVVNLLGYTYNFMVMFGMLLGLGMLIDGAIVVVEIADRKLQEGETPKAAYVYAVRRMFWPVVASTGTTLAAFLPLMFWPGVSGGFMKYLPVTVFAVLVGSLAYALFFAPVLGAVINRQREPMTGGSLVLVDQGRFNELGGITGIYARLLHFTTRRPVFVVIAAMAGLVGIVLIYNIAGKGMVYFTDVDPEFTSVNVNAKGNFSTEELRDIVVDVERRILDVGYMQSIYTRVGSGGIRGGSGTTEDRIGSMFIQLSDRRTRDISGFEVEELYRQAISDIPGVRAEVSPQEMGPPVGKEIQLQLRGKNLDVLEAETKRIHKHLASMEGLVAVDNTASVPGIEWELTVDRARAAMLGADMISAGAAVQLVTNGILMGKYRPNDVDDEVDIRIRYPSAARGIVQLDHVRVSTAEGQVPVSSFVTRKAEPKVSSIFRQNGERVMYVRANTRAGVIADNKVQEIKQWLATANVDPSISIVFRGANEEQEKSMAFISQAFVLALILMAVLLVTQFNSFYQAFLILSAVILSTVGVLLGLLVLDQPFSAIMTGVGVVALAGIIVNNNIVLIDTFNYLRRENPGWDLQRVIVTTGCQRLRPVFLTTFTTGFGLLPMASGVSVDLLSREIEVGGPVASFWVQLASAIVSGLTFATVLTLIVTPAMLILPHALRQMVVSVYHRVRRWPVAMEER